MTRDLMGEFCETGGVSRESATLYFNIARAFAEWARRDKREPDAAAAALFVSAGKRRNRINTMKTYTLGLKKFFTWAAGRGIWPNIAANLEPPADNAGYSRRKSDRITYEQVKQVTDKLRENLPTEADKDGDPLEASHKERRALRDMAVVCVAAAFGLSPLHIQRLNVGDVDAQNEMIVTAKTGLTEARAIHGEMSAALLAYYKHRAGAGPFAPLFISVSGRNYGQRLTIRSIRRIVSGAFADAGLSETLIGFHAFKEQGRKRSGTGVE